MTKNMSEDGIIYITKGAEIGKLYLLRYHGWELLEPDLKSALSNTIWCSSSTTSPPV